MLSAADFEKKQLVFVFLHRGEKMSFQNDNFCVKDKNGKIKFQCTCYRLFLVFAIGHGSITSGLIQRAKKFKFFIVMMTQSMRPYQIVGSSLEGNTILHKAQYSYDSLDLAKHITRNKIANQQAALIRIRSKNEIQTEAIHHLDAYLAGVSSSRTLQEIMGYEGSASRVYFSAFFNNVQWKRRSPRTKSDYVNATLDIGYTVLFSFIEAILSCYGFDLYCGVMHRDFYMRKSLVCDIVEPFRPLIDAAVKKAINLKQCREDHFLVFNGQYRLKWECNADYIAWMAAPLIKHKSEIHLYVQSYYRAFMKHRPVDAFPVFDSKEGVL